MSERYDDLSAMMERYKEEMRRAYLSRGGPPGTLPEELPIKGAALAEGLRAQPPEPRPMETAVLPPVGEPPLEARPELPEAIPREPEAEEGTGEPAYENGEQEIYAPMVDSGYIVVETYTGREAVPIPGADIAISSEDHDDAKGRMKLVRLAVTDSSGKTVNYKVKTVSRELSEEPGNPRPFATYYVRAKAPGYETVPKQPVDVFGGEVSQVPLEMIPVPEAPAAPLPMQEGG